MPTIARTRARSRTQSLYRETTEKAEEQRDKESRRNNIVLCNVPENDEPRSEANKADIAFCLQLFNNCLNTGTTEEDFVSVFRLGKRGDLTRPLLIQLAGCSPKNLIIESLYKLKHAETKFKKIIIAHDMTKTERAECKRLVAEAKLPIKEPLYRRTLYFFHSQDGIERSFQRLIYERLDEE